MTNRTRKIVLRVPVTPEERELIRQNNFSGSVRHSFTSFLGGLGYSPASIFAGSGYTPYACYVTFPHYYDTTTPPFCPQNAKNKRTLLHPLNDRAWQSDTRRHFFLFMDSQGAVNGTFYDR